MHDGLRYAIAEALGFSLRGYTPFSTLRFSGSIYD